VTLYRIRISSLALRQIDRASAWWRAHRDKAPSAFDDDIDEAIALIRRNRGVGQPVQLRKPARRIWLPRIRYFLYYRDRGEFLEIIALWHASRRPPKL
jgi:plasmid stabilization system protein ParE